MKTKAKEMDLYLEIYIVFCFNLPSLFCSQTKKHDNISRSKHSTGESSTQHSREDPPPGSKILNGEKAYKGEFPYITAISHSSNPMDYYGAGVILAPYWILTVKHVTRRGSGTGHLYVTPNYDNKVSGLKNGRKYSVEKYFCPRDKNADIALLKLRDPIPLDQEPYKFRKINMIKLDHELDPKKSITVAGWGYAQVYPQKGSRVPPGRKPFTLMKADVKLLPDDYCSQQSRFISIKFFCTSSEHRGTCYGDSGGPAVWKNERKSGDMLIGLTSAGSLYCKDEAFFVRVSFWRQWINEIMDQGGYTDVCS